MKTEYTRYIITLCALSVKVRLALFTPWRHMG